MIVALKDVIKEDQSCLMQHPTFHMKQDTTSTPVYSNNSLISLNSTQLNPTHQDIVLALGPGNVQGRNQGARQAYCREDP